MKKKKRRKGGKEVRNGEKEGREKKGKEGKREYEYSVGGCVTNFEKSHGQR